MTDESKQPWLSTQDEDQIQEELHYIKQWDKKQKDYPDMRLLKFDINVLEKYKNNEFCRIDSNTSNGDQVLRFISYNNSDVSTVSYFIRKNSIILFLEQFIFIPPNERIHWDKYLQNDHATLE
jgi:hypothetical protein